MKKMLKTSLSLIVVMALLLNPIYMYAEKSSLTTQQSSQRVKEMMDNILKNYNGGEVDEQKLLDGAMKGMFETLDPYSEYYTDKEYQQFLSDVSGEFVGIGVQIMQKDNSLEVISTLPNTPAEKTGLLSGDIIKAVDGEKTDNIAMDVITNKIRGKEGTDVKITIKRGNEIKTLNITRQKIKMNAIKVNKIEELLKQSNSQDTSNMRYIQIADFNANVAEDLRVEIEKAQKENVKGIIFDVRDNPGGYLDQVEEICRMIIPKGPIDHIIQKDGEKHTTYSYLEKAPFKIVVLVNGNSASASELFSGAVKDSKVGQLVGEKTFGKGVVQTVLDTSYGNKYKMTVAEYLTRNENHINKIGIQPNVKVEIPKYIYEITKKYKLGDKDEQIPNVKSMLNFLGYNVQSIDENYDKQAMDGIAKFQKDQKLYPYGIADFTTQKKLNEVLQQKLKEKDVQLEKAVEVLKEELK